MNFFSGIISGLREAWANKFRSFLSMAGIVLGVASLVAMMGVAEGLIRDFRLLFESEGGVERVNVEINEVPEWQRTRAGSSPGKTLADAEAIRANVPLAHFVSPEVKVSWRYHRYKDRSGWENVFGVTSDYQGIYETILDQGRFISDVDVENYSAVCVIGWDAYKKLFRAKGDVIGKRITIHGRPFTVIGVEKEFTIMRDGRNTADWKNRRVYIPATTGQRLFTHSQDINRLEVRITDVNYLTDLVAQIENTLLATHRGIHDVRVETRIAQLDELDEKEASFKYSLGTLAVISLLVGGIGITNVMLASINERVREIGVRKAVGARASDIFTQFVAESVSISLIGGIIGIAVSYALVGFVESILPEDTVRIILTTEALAIGFISSVATGILSGIYPAIRAARLDPITALRYE